MPLCGMFDSLAEYPHWFVVACAFVAAAVVLWVLMKLMKLAIWAAIFALVVAVAAIAVGLFLK
jgi:hypothetical protein